MRLDGHAWTHGSIRLGMTALLASLAAAVIAAPPQTRVVRVTALDLGSGAPVLDLGPADFEVREAGIKRTITRVSLTNGVMRVAVLVDNSFLAGPAINYIRTGLQALVDGLPPQDEVVLATISRQLQLRAQPTADREKLKKAIGLVFPDSASGTPLIDGFLEMDDRFVRQAQDRRSVFVILTTDGPETSGAQIEEFNQRLHDLALRAATVHAVVLSHPQEGKGNEPELCLSLTQTTGGHFDSIATNSGIPDKLRAIAGRIAAAQRQMNAEYELEFVSGTKASADIEVGATRPDLRVERPEQQRSR